MLRETKENVQGTNSDGKETGTQINGVDQKETSNQKRMKKQEFKKMRTGVGTSRKFSKVFKDLNHRGTRRRRGRARNRKLI